MDRMVDYGPAVRRTWAWWVWPLVLGGAGALLTPPALFAAMLSGGMGHGHYVAARAFFPWPLLATHLTGESITGAVLLLAVIQLPLYGFAIGLGRGRWRLAMMLAVALLHGAGVYFCFSGSLPNFA
jgi:hypothetical protein